MSVTAKKTCSFEGCFKQVWAKGLCRTHHQRWWKHGDPAVVLGRPQPSGPPPKLLCECGQRVYRKGLCEKHYSMEGHGGILPPTVKNPRQCIHCGEWMLFGTSVTCDHCDRAGEPVRDRRSLAEVITGAQRRGYW